MINTTQQTFYRLETLNAEQTRISYQTATGKILDNGSDDSTLFAKEVYIDDKIKTQDGIKTQIERTTAQNNVADSSIGEIKKLLDVLKTELIKANTSTATDENKKTIAVTIEGLKESIYTAVNTQVGGEYLFSGSDSSIPSFVKDPVSGDITYNGDNLLKKVAVDEGSYKERGVNGIDLMMYSSDIAYKGESLAFSDENIIIDQDGYEWKMEDPIVPTGGTLTFLDGQKMIDSNDTIWKLNLAKTDLVDVSGNNIPVTALATIPITYDAIIPVGTESMGINELKKLDYDGSDFLPAETIIPRVTTLGREIQVPSVAGNRFETKTNIFDAIDDVIDALKKVDSEGNAVSDEISKDVLSKSLDKISDSYDYVNNAHSELGSRNKVLDISLERVNIKLLQFNILSQKIGAADLGKLAIESKSLELTYTALYSTVKKTNELSLVNFLR